MIEVWLQYTCDGCDQTEYTTMPNESKAELNKGLKEDGWRVHGRLHYCNTCVKRKNKHFVNKTSMFEES